MEPVRDPAGEMPPKLAKACQRFDAAYAEWLKARADLADNAGDHSEEAEQARFDREQAAQMALIATPAPHASALWQKWELLERVLTDDADAGPSTYPVAIVAFAALKADIMALGLKEWRDL